MLLRHGTGGLTMTDRDRLIELNRKAKLYAQEKADERGGLVFIDDEVDYLIANGVILPPCKVGDMVYSFGYDWQKAKDVIAPYQITNITITQNKKGVWTKKYRAMRVLNGKTIDTQLNFEFDEIGKSVFLTREEAEKSLERSKSND